MTGAHDDTGTEELAALRAEVSRLRAQLDTRGRRAHPLTGLRRAGAAGLAAVTALALMAGVVGLWAGATTLNTDRWIATVAPLPRNPAVVAAVSQYTADQLSDVLDVEQRLRDVLPAKAAFVAGPLSGQVHDAIRRTVTTVVRSERFQKLWVAMNRRVHQQALAVINGTSRVVTAHDDTVRIDLLPLINQVLRVLGDQLPTLFGRKLTLPDLTSGQIPANLRTRVQDALNVSLPANFAQFTVYDAGRLTLVRRTVVTVKRGLAALIAGTALMLVLALLISPARRRTTVHLGVWLVIAAVAVTAVLRAVRGELLAQVPAGVYRDGTGAAVTAVTATLHTRGVQLIWIGVLLAVLAYLVGPGRIPVWLRRHTVVAARAAGRGTRHGYRAMATRRRVPALTDRHLDAVRVAGVVVAVGLALTLSSWTALVVILVALAAFQVGVTVLRRAGTRPRGADTGDRA